MAEKIVKKCSRKAFCTSLVNKLEPANAIGRKGLTVIIATNFTTQKDRTLGVAYKKSATDRGTMLNFCPCCGEQITFWDKSDIKPPRAKRKAK